MSSSNRIGGTHPTSAYARIQTPTTPAISTATQASEVVRAKAAKPVNLFDASTFGTTTTAKDSSGSAIALPSLSDDEMAQAQDLFAKVPDDKKEALNAASQQLGQALFAQLSQPPAKLTIDGTDAATPAAVGGISGLGAGKMALSGMSKAANASVTNNPTVSVSHPSPAVVSATQAAASSYTAATGSSGSDAVMATAYMGVAGLQGELGDFATTMQDTINTKKSYDTDASELQTAIAAWPDDGSKQPLPKVEIDGDKVTVTEVEMTKTEAQASLKNAQTASQNSGSDQQIQMIQMQQMQSSYSNAVNMISNLMKTGYEMTKNTIGNIHY